MTYVPQEGNNLPPSAMPAPACKKRVLSIQSHVVSGYVGNKAAVFPLQLLGFDVDVVNSVHFSNHTGYPHGVTGDVLNGTQLCSILSGLQKNNLLENVGHLLTGYIGSESFLRVVIDVLQTLRSNSSKVRFVCDPVLGDAGKFYVPKELVEVYKKEVIPLANVITPNQFEVEQLTGIPISNVNDATRACLALHALGPEMVVITSIVATENNNGDIHGNNTNNDNDSSEEQATPSTISIIASTMTTTFSTSETVSTDSTTETTTQTLEEAQIWQIDAPYIKGVFTGTGDLFTSLLLAWTDMLPNNLALALEKVVGTMHAVICRTSQEADSEAAAVTDGKGFNVCASRELRLIQCKREIESPEVLFKTRRIK